MGVYLRTEIDLLQMVQNMNNNSIKSRNSNGVSAKWSMGGRGQSSLKVRLLPLIHRWFSWKQRSKHTLISLSWVIHRHSTFLHFTKFHVNFACVYYINVENQTRHPRHISSNGSSWEGHHGLNTQLGGKRGRWDWTKMVGGKEKQIWRVWKCVSVSAFQRDGLSFRRLLSPPRPPFPSSSCSAFFFLW